MSRSRGSRPPSLIVRAKDAVVRLTESGVTWMEASTVTHIPYGALRDVSVAEAGARSVSLRLATRAAAGGERDVYEVECTERAGHAFRKALVAHIGSLPRSKGVPKVTVEARQPGTFERFTRGQLVMRALVVAFALNSVALLLMGAVLAAFITLSGFFAWWGCASLFAEMRQLVREARAQKTRGVEVEAEYAGNEVRRMATGRLTSMRVYKYTDLDGRVREYTEVPATKAPPAARKSLIVVPGGDAVPSTRGEAVFVPLVLVPVFFVVMVVLGLLGWYAMPGYLLLNL